MSTNDNIWSTKRTNDEMEEKEKGTNENKMVRASIVFGDSQPTATRRMTQVTQSKIFFFCCSFHITISYIWVFNPVVDPLSIDDWFEMFSLCSLIATPHQCWWQCVFSGEKKKIALQWCCSFSCQCLMNVVVSLCRWWKWNIWREFEKIDCDRSIFFCFRSLASTVCYQLRCMNKSEYTISRKRSHNRLQDFVRASAKVLET